jgi:hypothetical protein
VTNTARRVVAPREKNRWSNIVMSRDPRTAEAGQAGVVGARPQFTVCWTIRPWRRSTTPQMSARRRSAPDAFHVGFCSRHGLGWIAVVRLRRVPNKPGEGRPRSARFVNDVTRPSASRVFRECCRNRSRHFRARRMRRIDPPRREPRIRR